MNEYGTSGEIEDQIRNGISPPTDGADPVTDGENKAIEGSTEQETGDSDVTPKSAEEKKTD